ncbi:MAG: riboflavin synthase [Candidatus Nitrospinota bacterium M3_3B_026]
MFTGIVETMGRVASVRRSSGGMSIDVDAAGAVPDPKTGESVAVNGVCLTVTASRGDVLSFDVSKETLARSTFRDAGPGDMVNIERAMRMGDRLGGHLVSGHVDAVGKVAKVAPSGEGFDLEVAIPGEGMKYVIEKGSIAIDGISLTVASKHERSITIAIIPHTWEATALRDKNPGSTVNIEYDMIAKYVENFVKPENTSRGGLDEGFLRGAGFL